MNKQNILDYIEQIQAEVDKDGDNALAYFWVGTNTIKEMIKKLESEDKQ